MKYAMVMAMLLASCNKEPPPVTLGKCLVDVYNGRQAKKQTCTYEGYTWVCTRADDDVTCVRTGEAAGERGVVQP